MTIKTRIGQAGHLGKWEAHAQLVRLAVELREVLQEEGRLSADDITRFDGVVHAFLATLPAKVREEVREG